jgi:hypothetical protein
MVLVALVDTPPHAEALLAGKDVLAAAIGAIFGLVLALLAQPLLDDPARVLLVKLLGHLWVRSHSSLTGTWASVWRIGDGHLDRSEEIVMNLNQVGTRVAGKFDWKGKEYLFLGNRITSGFISGNYQGVEDGHDFHGVFHIKVMAREEFMIGRWMGFDDDNKILEGPWEWRRLSKHTMKDELVLSRTIPDLPKYPFELKDLGKNVHNAMQINQSVKTEGSN